MYKKDKTIAVVVFFITSALTYFSGLDYTKISSTVFAVVSVSIAVYIAVAAALLDSKYATSLKSIVDTRIKTKTQLGVLTEYLRWAGRFSIITIVISCCYEVFPYRKAMIFMQNLIQKESVIETINRLMSSVAFGIFALNILFLWLVFIFLINSLNKSA